MKTFNKMVFQLLTIEMFTFPLLVIGMNEKSDHSYQNHNLFSLRNNRYVRHAVDNEILIRPIEESRFAGYDLYDTLENTHLQSDVITEQIRKIDQERNDYLRNRASEIRTIYNSVNRSDIFHHTKYKRRYYKLTSEVYANAGCFIHYGVGNKWYEWCKDRSSRIKYDTQLSTPELPIYFVLYKENHHSEVGLNKFGLSLNNYDWDVGAQDFRTDEDRRLAREYEINRNDLVNWWRPNGEIKYNVMKEFYFPNWFKNQLFSSQALEPGKKLLHTAWTVPFYSGYQSRTKTQLPNFVEIGQEAKSKWINDDCENYGRFSYCNPTSHRMVWTSYGYHNAINASIFKSEGYLRPYMSEFIATQKNQKSGSYQYQHMHFFIEPKVGYGNGTSTVKLKKFFPTGVRDDVYTDDIFYLNFDDMFILEPYYMAENIYRIRVRLNDRFLKEKYIDLRKFLAISSKLNFELTYKIQAQNRDTSTNYVSLGKAGTYDLRELIDGTIVSFDPRGLKGQVRISDIKMKVSSKDSNNYRLIDYRNSSDSGYNDWSFRVKGANHPDFELSSDNSLSRINYRLINEINIDNTNFKNLYPSDFLNYLNLRKIFSFIDDRGLVDNRKLIFQLRIKVIPNDLTGELLLQYYDFARLQNMNLKLSNFKKLQTIPNRIVINETGANSDLAKPEKIKEMIKLNNPNIDETTINRFNVEILGEINDFEHEFKALIKPKDHRNANVQKQWNDFYQNQEITFYNNLILAPEVKTTELEHEPEWYTEDNIWLDLLSITPEIQNRGIIRSDFILKPVPENNKLKLHVSLLKNNMSGSKEYKFSYTPPPPSEPEVEENNLVLEEEQSESTNNLHEENRNEVEESVNNNSENEESTIPGPLQNDSQTVVNKPIEKLIEKTNPEEKTLVPTTKVLQNDHDQKMTYAYGAIGGLSGIVGLGAGLKIIKKIRFKSKKQKQINLKSS